MTTLHDGSRVLQVGAPLGDGAAVVIMVHGRGAGPENILDLVGPLDRPAVTYLAPAAAEHSWYPRSFMSPIAENEPKLSSALSRIGALVDDVVAAGVPRERIVLLGFSQGACLSGEFVVRHQARYGGIAMLSGGLIGPAGTTWPAGAGLAGTPVFLGCSDRDAHIPLERVEESAAVLGRLGGDVTLRIYPGMGHLVSADEVVEVRALLDRVLGTV